MTTPIATFSGLATGLDSAGLIQQLVGLESLPMTRLEERQQSLSGKSSKLSNIKTLLENLQEISQSMDSRSEFLFSKATSSDESVLKATASGGASLGTFDIDVASLASAERTYSDAFADTATFGPGTLSITVGADTAVDITVTAGDTLQTIASNINASSARVTAGILFDGTQYRLQVSGTEAGLSNAVSFVETGISLGLDNPANEIQAAADASFTVDGFPMSRSGNTVADAIPGITLELLDDTVTAGTQTITVDRDPETLKGKIQEFVDAYNAVHSAIAIEFGVSEPGPTSLVGDSTLRSLQSRMRSAATQPVTGLSEPYNSLYSVGIRTQEGGSLSFDESVFDSAFATDPEAISSLFVEDLAGGTTGIFGKLDAMVDEFIAPSSGLLTGRIKGFSDRISDIDDQLERMQLRLDKFEENLRKEFTALEILVSGLQSQGSQLTAMLGQLAPQQGG